MNVIGVGKCFSEVLVCMFGLVGPLSFPLIGPLDTVTPLFRDHLSSLIWFYVMLKSLGAALTLLTFKGNKSNNYSNYI